MSMRRVSRSHLFSAILGGLIVGAGMLAIGAGGRGRTETIVDEAPVASQPSVAAVSGLTPHDIYQQDAPGVLYVRAKLVAPVRSPFTMFHGRQSDTSTGSGFLVDHDGDLLTAYHVIDGADRTGGVTVEFQDGLTRRAGVVAVDPASDLAVLHVELRGLPPVAPLRLGESSTVRVGDPTLTIGNPFGDDRTLTSGIVSALQHRIQSVNGVTIDNVIQTDQPIEASNSGGPLLDAGGRVIGINSLVTAPSGGTRDGQALAFAVPIDTADPVLARAAHAGPVRVAYIGLGGGPVRNSPTGVQVTGVAKAGPAALAGLRRGDVIERVEGEPVDTISDVLSLVTTRSPGQSLTLTIRRRHRLRSVSVALGSRTGGAAR
jgi:S1-C subfamily serine protease